MDTVPAVGSFKLFGTDTAEMTMTTRVIVERVNVIRHVGDRSLAVLVDLFLDSLLLQATEKATPQPHCPSNCLSDSCGVQDGSIGRIGATHRTRTAFLGLSATGFAGFPQVQEHARSTIDTLARKKRRSNQAQ